MRREDITSTSIGKGVAIPHGIHEFVIKPAICIIKLKKPIDWSGDEVDIVFVLALKFSDIQETKDFFKYFYNLLNDERVLGSIRKADKPGKIAKTILGKSEDDERNNGQ